MENVKDLVLFSIGHNVCTRDNGLMIIGMGMGWKDTAMVINMKESLRITNLMVKESTLGSMVKFMKGNGNMD
jgi:hypothetical protein